MKFDRFIIFLEFINAGCVKDCNSCVANFYHQLPYGLNTGWGHS